MRRIFNFCIATAKHSYTRGVFFVTVGSLVVNVTNYLFHVVGGRYLGPSLYGGLASLISLLYLVSILSNVFSTTALRELTKLWARGAREKFLSLFKSLFAFFTIVGFLLLFIFSLGSPFVSQYLSLENGAFTVFVGLIGFFFMVNSLFGAFQQATLRFSRFSMFNAAAAALKILLVFLTWRLNLLIFGMLGSILISLLFYFVLSLHDYYFFVKKEKLRVKRGPGGFSLQQFLKKTRYVLMASLGMTSFLSLDTILVKHFFSVTASGLYSGVAVMGRVIHFFSWPLLIVMMPFIIKKREQKKDFKKFFFLTLVLVLLGSTVLLIFYRLFPSIVILLFYGERYLQARPLLPLFALYMLFYTLANVFVSYYVAMEEKEILFLPLIGALVQIVLINLFHTSLVQVIKISILCVSLLLVAFLVLFIRVKKQRASVKV